MTTTHDGTHSRAVEVLKATLLHVPFDGWSQSALLAGANDANVSPDTLDDLFPNGAIDAIAMYSRQADENMLTAYQELLEPPKKIHLSIRQLVLLRLEQAQSNKDAVRRALSVLALPMNSALSVELLYKTVDTMWLAVGQKDTGFSFYTRRATLAAVYSATVLAWLADDSFDMVKTAAFLDRRLSNVASIPRATAPLRKVISFGEKFVGILMKDIGKRHAR